jgi:TRAP-type mannitol/chloroaromatic compound transport system permease small subunit
MMVQMYGALFLMAGPYALAQDAHVRGDVIYRLFSFKVQARIDLTLYILFFFPGILALAYFGYEIASDSWRWKEVSWNSPARIQVYFFKSLIPLAGVLLILQGISESMRCVICIRDGKWLKRHEDVRETEENLILKKKEGERQRKALVN